MGIFTVSLVNYFSASYGMKIIFKQPDSDYGTLLRLSLLALKSR